MRFKSLAILWLEMRRKTEREIKQEFKNTISISEASIEKWHSTEGNEYLVFARVMGNPQKVEVLIDEKPYLLERLRENVYMNLIYTQEELKSNKVVIKAEIDSEHAQFLKPIWLPKKKIQKRISWSKKRQLLAARS